MEDTQEQIISDPPVHKLVIQAPRHISTGSVKLLGILGIFLFAGIFVLGYLPRVRRERLISQQAHAEEIALPVVNVARANRAAPVTQLSLPGNVQAVTEGPILARAEGYLAKRLADIGDRVKAGQLLAVIDAPDLDQQVTQAKATLDQATASLVQAEANLEQAKANEHLAEVTKTRNDTLVQRGVLSRQEGDQSTAAYGAQHATVHAVEASIVAAQQNVKAADANLKRLTELQAYKEVRAPFAGVITVRNVDTGTLINSQTTMLYRIAQFDVLRIFVNVPQSFSEQLRPGMPADVSIQELSGRHFGGKVTRVSGSLDSNTRTLLTEVQVPNPEGKILPGMYATVQIAVSRTVLPVLIPGDAIVTRATGASVAVADSDGTVHYHPVQLGRDYGLEVEVTSGLRDGQMVVVNPTDDVREGVKVKPQFSHEGPASTVAQKTLGGAP
ncbi:MAG TPA: efflux RND transporter periplasmic adaptor subunit [Bryobacteraceae bacterium]|jgi:RND family efflux transporter MFP subunit|nr:efflux RND transporter periplasmic adaptor subunit [Bryobacteraceae bacterium]